MTAKRRRDVIPELLVSRTGIGSAIAVFRIPGVPPGLNGPGGLIRMHWSERKRERESWKLKLRMALGGKRLRFSECEVTFRLFVIRWRDWDNACAGFKLIGDALTDLSVIPDDSPKYVRSLTVDQCDVPSGTNPFTEIVIAGSLEG